jgi:hypothetical protein
VWWDTPVILGLGKAEATGSRVQSREKQQQQKSHKPKQRTSIKIGLYIILQTVPLKLFPLEAGLVPWQRYA